MLDATQHVLQDDEKALYGYWADTAATRLILTEPDERTRFPSAPCPLASIIAQIDQARALNRIAESLEQIVRNQR